MKNLKLYFIKGLKVYMIFQFISCSNYNNNLKMKSWLNNFINKNNNSSNSSNSKSKEDKDNLKTKKIDKTKNQINSNVINDKIKVKSIKRSQSNNIYKEKNNIKSKAEKVISRIIDYKKQEIIDSNKNKRKYKNHNKRINRKNRYNNYENDQQDEKELENESIEVFNKIYLKPIQSKINLNCLYNRYENPSESSYDTFSLDFHSGFEYDSINIITLKNLEYEAEIQQYISEMENVLENFNECKNDIFRIRRSISFIDAYLNQDIRSIYKSLDLKSINQNDIINQFKYIKLISSSECFNKHLINLIQQKHFRQKNYEESLNKLKIEFSNLKKLVFSDLGRTELGNRMLFEKDETTFIKKSFEELHKVLSKKYFFPNECIQIIKQYRLGKNFQDTIKCIERLKTGGQIFAITHFDKNIPMIFKQIKNTNSCIAILYGGIIQLTGNSNTYCCVEKNRNRRTKVYLPSDLNYLNQYIKEYQIVNKQHIDYRKKLITYKLNKDKVYGEISVLRDLVTNKNYPLFSIKKHPLLPLDKWCVSIKEKKEKHYGTESDKIIEKHETKYKSGKIEENGFDIKFRDKFITLEVNDIIRYYGFHNTESIKKIKKLIFFYNFHPHLSMNSKAYDDKKEMKENEDQLCFSAESTI